MPAVFGISLPPVGLQGHPGLRVVAAAVWRSLSLAVLQKHICSASQEEPEETTFYRSSTTFFFFRCVFELSLFFFSLLLFKKKKNHVLKREVFFVFNSRYTFQTILPGGDVQGRVSVDVDGLQITMGVQEQLGDVHAA